MRNPSFLGAGVCPLLVAAAILWCGAEQCLAQETSKTGASKEERIVVHGEVVEVSGDKVRVAVKDKQQPHVGDPVKITFEIQGTGIKANVASGKVTNVETGFASVDITDKTSEIRNGYMAEITSAGATVAKKPPTDAKKPPTDAKKPPTDAKKPPTDAKKPPTDAKKPPTDAKKPPTDAKDPPDLSGEWEETFRLGKSVWTLKRRADGRYAAQQQQYSKATGIGAYTDGVLKIEWETAEGYAGIQEWRLNPTLDAGKGKGIGNKKNVGTDRPDRPSGWNFDVSVVRLGKPKPDTSIETKTKTDTDKREEKKDTPEKTGKTGAPNDLSGSWRENTGANAPIWILKRIADGKYGVRQDVIGHPSTGCKGTAQMDNGILSIGWDQAKLKNHGGGKWLIDGTQTKANAGHYTQSFNGKDRRDYQCTVTRLADIPAAELKSKGSPNDKTP